MTPLLKSGVFGLLIVAAFVAILVTGALVVGLTRSRRMLAVFGLLAFLPLLFGLAGTCLGNLKVDQAAGAMGPEAAPIGQSMVAAGRREARISSYLGAAATGVLLLAAGGGLALTRSPGLGPPRGPTSRR